MLLLAPTRLSIRLTATKATINLSPDTFIYFFIFDICWQTLTLLPISFRTVHQTHEFLPHMVQSGFLHLYELLLQVQYGNSHPAWGRGRFHYWFLNFLRLESGNLLRPHDYASKSNIFVLVFRVISITMLTNSGIPRNFFGGRGRGSTNSVEDRGQNEDLGSGSPLVRGSGGSCILVQEISFHMVKLS